MLRDRIRESVELMAFQICRVLQWVMESPAGINQKVEINTLEDSGVYQSATFELSGDMELITVLANDYLKYIESGREQHVTRVPFRALLEWAQKNGIPTDNETIYSIQSAIWRDGIPARPIIDPTIEEIENHWSEWAETLFNDIMSDIEDWFRN